MNRGEVIGKIIEELELMRGVDNNYYVYPDDDIIADRLLRVIEKSGYCNLAWSDTDWFGEEDEEE